MSVLVPCRCSTRSRETKRLPKGPACVSKESTTTSGFLFAHRTDKSRFCHPAWVNLLCQRDTSPLWDGAGYSVRTTRDGSRGRTRAKVETIPGFGRAAATPGFPALRVNGNMDLGTDSTLRALCLVALRPVLPYRTNQQNPTDNAYIYLSGLIPSVSGTSLRLVQHHRTGRSAVPAPCPSVSPVHI